MKDATDLSQYSAINSITSYSNPTNFYALPDEVDILSRAFQHDAGAIYLQPNAELRPIFFHWVWTKIVTYCLLHGQVFTGD